MTSDHFRKKLRNNKKLHVNLPNLVTARKRSLGQGNIFRSVCQEFCPQGGSASVHAGIPHPPQDRAPPQTRYPPPGSRHHTPPGAEHAGRYGQRAGGTHPTGMESWIILSLFGLTPNKLYFNLL